MADSPSELQLEIEKLERKHAEHPEGRFFVPLANAYRKLGDIETAEALLRSGVERHPDYLSAHIVLGRCLADRGAVDEAEDEFRFVLTQDPQNLIALRTLGELALADSRPGEAAEWYRELLAVDPMNEDARQALDSLADAPAPELETEFRSGAGWWVPAAETGGEADEEERSTSSEQPFDTPQLEGFTTTAADDLAESTNEHPAERAGASFDSGDDLSLRDEPPTSVDHGAAAADDSYAWGGYDDLPGLRSEEEAGATPPTSEPTELVSDEGLAPTPLSEEPGPFTGFDSGGDDDDDGGSRFGDDGSSEVVTETIAELYARQGLHERAAAVYRELIRRRGGDPVLEQRLAEIERLGRAEEAGTEVETPEETTTADLTFADEEALLSAPLDVEDEDPFAATFADGFRTVYEEKPESPLNATEPHASFPDEWTARMDAEGEQGPAEVAAERFDEHPLPELAPRPKEEEAGAAPPGSPTGASIVHFLGAMAAWRPAGATPTAPTAPSVAAPEPLGELPEARGGWEAATAPAETAEPPTAEGWTGEPVDGDYLAGQSVAEPWETPVAEPISDAYAEPWDTAPVAEDEAAADLPYLEEVVDSAAAGGTGPAEDEPFPWELPGAAPLNEGGEPLEPSPGELDPFFMDDVEPASMHAGELPEAPAPEGRSEPEPEVRSARVDQTEDEDLESFQAWLRSLKR